MHVIKKYPNRRLYDTQKSAYITVADVLKIIRSGEDFQVVDAESGNDITRTVLVQIITEQEGGASPIFTTDMLTRFIRVYDDSSQALFGEFLDKNMKMFSEQQKQFQDQLGNIIGSPIQIMKDLTERNLAMWSDMQSKFMDMAMGRTASTDKAGDKTSADDKPEAPADDADKKKPRK